MGAPCPVLCRGGLTEPGPGVQRSPRAPVSQRYGRGPAPQGFGQLRVRAQSVRRRPTSRAVSGASPLLPEGARGAGGRTQLSWTRSRFPAPWSPGRDIPAQTQTLPSPHLLPLGAQFPVSGRGQSQGPWGSPASTPATAALGGVSFRDGTVGTAAAPRGHAGGIWVVKTALAMPAGARFLLRLITQKHHVAQRILGDSEATWGGFQGA